MKVGKGASAVYDGAGGVSGKARGEKLYPIRTGVVTYIHPKRRYVTVAIMGDGKEIKESFRPEEVLV